MGRKALSSHTCVGVWMPIALVLRGRKWAFLWQGSLQDSLQLTQVQGSFLYSSAGPGPGVVGFCKMSPGGVLGHSSLFFNLLVIWSQLELSWD